MRLEGLTLEDRILDGIEKLNAMEAAPPPVPRLAVQMAPKKKQAAAPATAIADDPNAPPPAVPRLAIQLAAKARA